MTYAIFLCGPPGCGKSTYASNELPSDFLVYSTDNLIRKEAERTGKAYDDIFKDYFPSAEAVFKAQIKQSNQFGMNYIIDQTNLTENSRKGKLRLIDKDVTKIAVHFPSYTESVLKKRVAARVEAGGHNVPDKVIETMYLTYRMPQKTEGFDLVVSSSQFIDVMKVMKFHA